MEALSSPHGIHQAALPACWGWSHQNMSSLCAPSVRHPCGHVAANPTQWHRQCGRCRRRDEPHRKAAPHKPIAAGTDPLLHSKDSIFCEMSGHSYLSHKAQHLHMGYPRTNSMFPGWEWHPPIPWIQVKAGHGQQFNVNPPYPLSWEHYHPAMGSGVLEFQENAQSSPV